MHIRPRGNYGVISVAQETHGAVRSQPPAAFELFDRAPPGGNATDRQVVATGPGPPSWRACADRQILGTATRQDRRPRSRPVSATVRGEAHYDRNRSQARTGLCRPEDMQGDDQGGNALQDEGRPWQEALQASRRIVDRAEDGRRAGTNPAGAARPLAGIQITGGMTFISENRSGI